MTKEEIEGILSEIGVPFRYHHFSQREMQEIELPILVWNIPGTNNFFADGVVYQKINKIDFEIYADEKDWKLEKKVEDILNKHQIAWEQTASAYLETEKMYETLYEMEV